MANHKGSEGTVTIGANAIAELQSWSLSEQANTIDDTTINDTARTFQSGTTTWSGSAEAFWDETDTSGQGALTAGASVTLNMYPEGNTSGDTYYTGTALVTGIQRSGSNDAIVSVSFTFQGTGALTESTVA